MFKNHPKGLIPAALANMGERFGYYIMNAILVLFLCAKFGLSSTDAALIYSFFYAGIYILSLVGGLIADKIKNYKGTIMCGLVVMALGYILLAIPITATLENNVGLLVFTCAALLMIALGNGLFKGNLQAIVGQMYDNAPKETQKRRDSGFQIFYVFINIGGLIAPFVAPLLRSWWLHKNFLEYNADLPALCHKYLELGTNMHPQQLANLHQYADGAILNGSTLGGSNLQTFCSTYLEVFNTGFHYAFIASVAAMIISLVIFAVSRKFFPNPIKHIKEQVTMSEGEKKAMASELKQRIYALFAVLGVVVFFWFSFHQNGVSLSYFARDFVNTSSIPPEIWQAVNPFFVVFLTPIIMWIFGSMRKKGKEPSTPKKIGIGMGIAALGYTFLTIVSSINGLPSGDVYTTLTPDAQQAIKLTPFVLIGMYFFMTVAELFISPLGLSFVSKVAPPHMQGLMQGLWLAATAVGNILLFIGGILYAKVDLMYCWMVFLVVCALSMIVMLAMVKWLERVTGEKKEDKKLQEA
ncbi:MAG: peptide MFS transporter [Bacteroidales bacterium]|jgi:POT family proton-dependent oligopeptide transporter|nr:peptide MFS transporter [Bacteroidales bacterium]